MIWQGWSQEQPNYNQGTWENWKGKKKKKNVFFVLMYFLNSLLSKKKKKKNLGKLLWYKRSKTLRDILLLESNKLGLHDITCHWFLSYNSTFWSLPVENKRPPCNPSYCSTHWRYAGDFQRRCPRFSQSMCGLPMQRWSHKNNKSLSPCHSLNKKKTKQKQTPFSHSSLQALIVFSLVTLNALPFYQLSQDPSSSIRLIYLRG